MKCLDDRSKEVNGLLPERIESLARYSEVMQGDGLAGLSMNNETIEIFGYVNGGHS